LRTEQVDEGGLSFHSSSWYIGFNLVTDTLPFYGPSIDIVCHEMGHGLYHALTGARVAWTATEKPMPSTKGLAMC
jgi:hypothetical protein